MEKKSSRVCVTGAAGYIASLLVKKLLEKGHVVHATLRSLDEVSKTRLLKSLPGADTRLVLFEADIYDADKFMPAFQGCEYVFLVATPLQHNALSSKYKNTTEAALAAVQNILQACENWGSVKRVIYTGSVTAASPLKDDGTGFKDFLDESCWTPLHLSLEHCEDHEKGYTSSKTLSEEKALSYNSVEKKKGSVEVVSLVCGLVGGEALLPYAPGSVQIITSPLTGNPLRQRQLKFLQALLGSVPLVHVEDVCEAHLFCMEKPSMAGRFMCVSGYPTMQDFVDYYEQMYPKLIVPKDVEGVQTKTQYRSQKLVDAGFKFRYDLNQIFVDSVECMKRTGAL